jgi:hypothetical protein
VVTIEITRDALLPVMQKYPELATSISARVMERRQRLDEISSPTEEDELTIRSRIKSFFGLRHG